MDKCERCGSFHRGLNGCAPRLLKTYMGASRTQLAATSKSGMQNKTSEGEGRKTVGKRTGIDTVLKSKRAKMGNGSSLEAVRIHKVAKGERAVFRTVGGQWKLESRTARKKNEREGQVEKPLRVIYEKNNRAVEELGKEKETGFDSIDKSSEKADVRFNIGQGQGGGAVGYKRHDDELVLLLEKADKVARMNIGSCSMLCERVWELQKEKNVAEKEVERRGERLELVENELKEMKRRLSAVQKALK